MATIRKRGTKWQAIIRRKGFPDQVKTFRIKRDAKDWARGAEDQITRGVSVDRSSAEALSLEKALDRYLSEVSPTKAEGSQRAEITHAIPLKLLLGKYSLAAISADVVAGYRDTRLDTLSKQTGRKISSSTVRGELALLSHLYEISIKEWRLGLISNPVRLIRKPKAHPGRNRRLSWVEMRRLLKAVDARSNPILGFVVRIALYTGMRHGEIINLTEKQVDLQRRLVFLQKTKNGTARTVPLSVRATREFSKALGNPKRHKNSDLIFPGNKSRSGCDVIMRRPYTTNQEWRKAVQAAGLTDFRFHDLRHEAVSRLVEMGLSDQEVSAISGHKTMQMVRRYTHLRAEDLVARLDRK